MKLSLNSFFFDSFAKTIKNWEIKIEHINALKNQIPSLIQGAYCPKVLSFNNKEIFEKYKPSNIELSDFITDISISLQLYTRNIRMSDLSDIFIKEFNIKDYHIKLIQRIYFNCMVEYGFLNIEIDDKRPFGNSFIEGDILEEIDPNIFKEVGYGLNKYEKNNDYYNSLAWDTYYEVINILITIIKTFPIKYRHFEFMSYEDVKNLSNDNLQKKFFTYNWTISKISLRDELLNKLLNE